MNDSIERLAAEVVDYAQRLGSLALAPNTQGNLSARDPASGLIAITPHDLPYDVMTVDDIVIVDDRGNVRGGEREPSHETLVHCAVYRARSDVRAIVHAEPIYVNVWGVLGEPIPAVVVSQLLAVGGDAPTMPFMPSGSDEFGQEMLRVMGDKNAVVWSQHGCLTIGADLEAAMKVTVALEGGAQIAYLARVVGSPLTLSLDDFKVAVG